MSYESVDPKRFWAKVDKSGECWTWTGAHGRYGTFHIPAEDIKSTTAHRIAYVLSGGIIPDGCQLDHLCRNTLCVRPEHLEPVTPQENQRRNRRNTCHVGHPKDTGADKRVVCRTCKLQRQRERREREKETNPKPPLGTSNLSKTGCPAGHPYDEENTYVSKSGRRHCRACSVARTKQWRADRRVTP